MDLIELPTGDFIRHPWETSRCSFFQKLIVQHELNKPSTSVLDIGSGDAYFAIQSRKLWKGDSTFVCWDSQYSPTNIPTHSQIAFVKEKPAEQFEVILLLDVLEHIEDDKNFLTDLVQKKLKNEGHLLFSVPAWPKLFSNHDRSLKHFRRYRPSQGATLLNQAGLKVLAQGGLFHTLLLPRIFSKLFFDQEVKNIEPPLPLQWKRGKTLYLLTYTFLKMDNLISHLSSRLGLPIPGLSWWAVCKKIS